MESDLNVGIDVSKDALEIAIEGQAATVQIANDSQGISRWLRTLAVPCRIGIESTGHYHQALVRGAIGAGHTVYLLNASDLSHYMRCLGRRAKTDQLDAQGIARYVAREYAELHPYQLPTRLQTQLDQSTQRRHLIVKTQVALRQSFAEVEQPPRTLTRVLKAYQALIKEIDAGIAKIIKKDSHLAAHAKQLKTVVGFGELLSAVMAHALTRRSFANSDAFVAFAGLDPRARDSGQLRGKRFLTKRGPAELRRLLYVAAMSASRTKVWKPIYDHHRQRGRATTEALVIIARKLARVAFAMVKHKCAFNPQLLGKTACT